MTIKNKTINIILLSILVVASAFAVYKLVGFDGKKKTHTSLEKTVTEILQCNSENTNTAPGNRVNCSEFEEPLIGQYGYHQREVYSLPLSLPSENINESFPDVAINRTFSLKSSSDSRTTITVYGEAGLFSEKLIILPILVTRLGSNDLYSVSYSKKSDSISQEEVQILRKSVQIDSLFSDQAENTITLIISETNERIEIPYPDKELR